MIELKDLEKVKKKVIKRSEMTTYILQEPVFVIVVKKASNLKKCYCFDSRAYAETNNKLAYIVRVNMTYDDISILIRIPGWHYGHEGAGDYGSLDDSQWYVAPDMIELWRRA